MAHLREQVRGRLLTRDVNATSNQLIVEVWCEAAEESAEFEGAVCGPVLPYGQDNVKLEPMASVGRKALAKPAWPRKQVNNWNRQTVSTPQEESTGWGDVLPVPLLSWLAACAVSPDLPVVAEDATDSAAATVAAHQFGRTATRMGSGCTAATRKRPTGSPPAEHGPDRRSKAVAQ